MVAAHVGKVSELHRFLNSRKGAALESVECCPHTCPCTENGIREMESSRLVEEGATELLCKEKQVDFFSDEIDSVIWHPPLIDPDFVLHRTRPAPYRSLLLRLFRDTQDF